MHEYGGTDRPTNAVQQVFSVDVPGLSEKIDISEDEFLSGIARNQPCVALDQILDQAQFSVDDEADHDGYYHDVCLLISSRTINHDGKETLVALQIVDKEGNTILDLLLSQLMKTAHPITHLVVCRPQRHAVAITKIIDRQCINSSRRMAIDFVPAIDEATAIYGTCKYLNNNSNEVNTSKRPSNGFLILRSDRVFDAPTLDIMLMSTDEQEEMSMKPCIRALMDLDVNEPEDTAPLYAGLFTCSSKCVAAFERMFSVENRRQYPTLEDAIAGMQIAKVVTRNYSDWKYAIQDNQGINYNDHRRLEVIDAKDEAKHNEETSTFALKEVKQRTSGACLQEGHAYGYSGYRVSVKPTSPAKTKQSNNSRSNASSEIRQPSYSQKTPLLLGHLEQAKCLEQELEATKLSEADLEALLEPHKQAFLLQVGPVPPTTATSEQSNLHDIFELQQSSSKLILALPDRKLSSVVSHLDEDLLETSASQLTRRRFSQLPSDVRSITLEAQVEPPLSMASTAIKAQRVSVCVVVRKQVPFIGYGILIMAVFAVASQGAALDLLVGVPPLLRLFWRVTGTSLVFAPFAALSVWQDGWPRLTWRKIALFVLCVASHTIYNATFLIALSLTSIGHVYLFANCHSLLIVVSKLLLRQPLGGLELLGAAVGFSGGAITTLDHAEDPSDNTATSVSSSSGVMGDMIAFAGAFAGMCYFLTAKRVRPMLSIWIFLFGMTALESVFLLGILLWNNHGLETSALLFSTDKTQGLLGWLHHLDIEAYLVFIGSFMGTMGFISSMKYFDPLVVSVSTLVEPMIATIIGIALGMDRIPGPATVFGGFGIVLGCLMVLVATHRTTAKVDVSDAISIKLPQDIHADHSKRHSTFHPITSAHATNYGSFS